MLHSPEKPYEVVIATGGGAGAVMGPGVTEALGPEAHVTIVVPSGDDGGSTGRARRAFGGPAVGDVRNVLAATSSNGAGKLFDTRFGPADTLETVDDMNERLLEAMTGGGTTTQRAATILEQATLLSGKLDTLRGHAYGNIVMTALRLDHDGSLTGAAQEAAEWLKARATVLPITDEAHTVHMWDGKTHIIGEDSIDGHRIADLGKVTVWLENKNGKAPAITPEAAAALAHADKILLGPGSHFTSMLPIAMCENFAKAIAEQYDRGGQIGTVANLVVEPHVMPSLTVAQHERILRRPLGGRKFDFLLYNTETDALPPDAAVSCRDEEVRLVDAMAIGARLVDCETVVTRDPNDAVAQFRGTARHDPRQVVSALQQHALLPV